MLLKDYPFEEGRRFIADLADALRISYKIERPRSDLATFRRVKPTIEKDYLIFAEGAQFRDGRTLARVRLFADTGNKGQLMIGVTQYDRNVLPHVARLFAEQDYPGISMAYVTGLDVKNVVQAFRRHAA
ncbi:MAG: hypothetical protein KKD18_04025 [Nanoarchaeota archaeon]|nr:hypothetical protein [Nanoarchaeota archaeon]MBU0977560.1 hypothetical protein [Nanoarchaeota archaeon]